MHEVGDTSSPGAIGDMRNTRLAIVILHAEQVVSVALTKLVLRLRKLMSPGPEVNRITGEALLQISAILRLGESPSLPHPIDADSLDRIATCIQVCAIPCALSDVKPH